CTAQQFAPARAAPHSAAASRSGAEFRWAAGRSHLFTKSIQIRSRESLPVCDDPAGEARRLRGRKRRGRARALAAAMALATIAGGAAVEAQGRRATLTVKSVLCITDRREETCAISVLVAWRSDGAGRY